MADGGPDLVPGEAPTPTLAVDSKRRGAAKIGLSAMLEDPSAMMWLAHALKVRGRNIHIFVKFDNFPMDLSPNLIQNRQLTVQ